MNEAEAARIAAIITKAFERKYKLNHYYSGPTVNPSDWYLPIIEIEDFERTIANILTGGPTL